MKNVEVLKDLDDRGLLKPLVVGGIVPAKVYTYMHIYYHVDLQLRKKVNKKQAVCNTAACFSVSPRCVYRAISALK